MVVMVAGAGAGGRQYRSVVASAWGAGCLLLAVRPTHRR